MTEGVPRARKTKLRIEMSLDRRGSLDEIAAKSLKGDLEIIRANIPIDQAPEGHKPKGEDAGQAGCPGNSVRLLARHQHGKDAGSEREEDVDAPISEFLVLDERAA
jgi:hypothetical protein